MAWIDGFVLAVPTANKAVYADYAARMWPMFRKYGALRLVECWGEEVPGGTLTSFPMAVRLEEGESVVFAWIEWPDAESSRRCHASHGTDPGWEEVGPLRPMPFDGARLIWGHFAPLVDLGA